MDPQRIQWVAEKFHAGLSTGCTAYVNNRSWANTMGHCYLCGKGPCKGYYSIEFRKDARLMHRIFPIHCKCMNAFHAVRDAVIVPVTWTYASRAYLLPLGDVCGVISRVLRRLVLTVDIYRAMSAPSVPNLPGLA